MTEIIESGNLREVSAFYEHHPYPPPVDDLESHGGRWDDQRREIEAHLLWPTQPIRADRNVLIAGCGTFQAARHAMRWPQCQVTGIDVSAASIAASQALKDKYKLRNLELKQLPIEGVSDLKQAFDYIVCTGVLHHLPDPDQGLSALHDALTIDGALHLMVYAPYGRAGVYLLQDYCRRLGIGTSESEIRDLGASLEALPADHPIVALLKNSLDFRSQAGLADALLHPQDRAYTVEEFLAFVTSGGFQFGRWMNQAPYLPHCGAQVNSPHHQLLIDLPLAQQYAALELFRGTMLRHSALVYRGDFPGNPQPISFDGDDWLNYIPLRRPNTICVEEQLPPSAAGVLINQRHTFNDIYLPIDVFQKGLYDAIDGKRRISEIATRPAERETARIFFQRLWWYDQVVFDLS